MRVNFKSISHNLYVHTHPTHNHKNKHELELTHDNDSGKCICVTVAAVASLLRVFMVCYCTVWMGKVVKKKSASFQHSYWAQTELRDSVNLSFLSGFSGTTKRLFARTLYLNLVSDDQHDRMFGTAFVKIVSGTVPNLLILAGQIISTQTTVITRTLVFTFTRSLWFNLARRTFWRGR